MRKSYIFACIFLIGCSVGPDYEKPKLDVPELQEQKEISAFTQDKWWSIFNSKVLNELEEYALKNNADLEQAVANLAVARAAVDQAFGDLLPSIGASASGSKNFISTRGNQYFEGLSRSRHALSYLTSVGLSYEIDFFGKYRRANEAARAMMLSTETAGKAIYLSVTSEVAKGYFLIRALDAKLSIARRTLKSREDAYKVYQSRFKNGYCTELDLRRVEAEMRSVETMVLQIENQLAKAETALSVLIGCSPRMIVERKTATGRAIDKLKINAPIPSGIPSDILERRPDIASAESALIAANAQIGVAEAAHFPSFSLTGALGFESKNLANLCMPKSDMWSFGGSISLPIFAGGKLSALTDSAKAQYEAQLAIYKKTVQTAFKEVLDALVTTRKSRAICVAKNQQVQALQVSYNLALKQESAGLIGLIDLLDVERSLLNVQMELVEALQNQLNATVDLCKALGGGWHTSQLLK